MSHFESYRSVEAAPENSQDSLQKTVDQYGQVLNIFGDMAASPLPIDVYGMAQSHVMENATLGPNNANLVQLAVSVENDCRFCVAAHSWAADNNFSTDKDVVNAIREGIEGPDAQINALVHFTKALVQKRGKISDTDTESFLNAGYTKEQAFEILTIAAYKTITNYTSNMVGTQPNDFLADYVWSPEEPKMAA